MKWLLVCLAVFFMVAPAMAGEDPYIAIVGNDCAPGFFNPFFDDTCPTTGAFGVIGAAAPFYFSPKHTQFMLDQALFSVPVCFGTTNPSSSTFLREGGAGCESFFSQTPTNQPEVCDVTGTGTIPPFVTRGKPNARVTAGNAGFYEWWIRLPKKPSGEINIVLQCGVLKPNGFAIYHFDAIELCAAETGERIGAGTCTRAEVDPGVSPVIPAALPRITAIVYPGPFNDFDPFHLTAFKNPGTYTVLFGVDDAASMANNAQAQILDGSVNARILLKACMDKTLVTKLPVTGQGNALGELENDLEAGDIIYVRMDVPRQGTTDVYCHAQSVKLAGVGESPF